MTQCILVSQVAFFLVEIVKQVGELLRVAKQMTRAVRTRIDKVQEGQAIVAAAVSH